MRINTSDSAAFPADVMVRVVGGPAAGREYPIRSKRVTLGRALTADISVPDNVISRLHVVIYFDEACWKIADLGSTNGTWVKGEKITGDTELPIRAPVRIGNTLFELYMPTTTIEESTSFDESLITYKVAPITADSMVLSTVPSERVIRREQQKLRAIYQVQSLLNTTMEETDLYHHILEIVSDIIAADMFYLLIYTAQSDIFEPVAGITPKGRLNLSSENFVSRSIVNYVKEKNEAILSIDAPNDERFHSNSLCGFNVQSVMCAPMFGKRKLTGIIYLAARKSEREYEQEDLKLLTIIAHSAGMAIENTQLMEENIRAERMAAIGITAARLSHDVKNILNGLEGSISLLKIAMDNDDKTIMNEAWDILSKNHKRMSTLVLDLLNLAKEDSIELALYNVADIINETIDLVKIQMRDEKINIIFDKKSKEMFAEVDSRGLHRVILNLISNAIDSVNDRHKKSGQGLIEIKLDLEENGTIMIIAIADNGMGIPVDQQEKVFEMFHTSKGNRGTGLGLAVSKRIIDNHKGKIILKSVSNEGTSMTIKIPVRQKSGHTDRF